MKTKKELIEDYIAKPFEIGESVYITDKSNKSVVIKDIIGDEIFYEEYKSLKSVKITDIKKQTYNIGVNPFSKSNWHDRISYKLFNIEGILFSIGFDVDKLKIKDTFIDGVEVPELDWNPTILDSNNNEVVYQRDFVWSLEDSKLLIESIYNSLNIGTFIIKKQSYDWIENRIKEGKIEHTAFKQIVDGKQRLSAIIGFLQNRFSDLQGNYFSELSDNAKNNFFNFQLLSYGELGENTTDSDIKKIFLNINFTGKQMSKEHIEFVKSINL